MKISMVIFAALLPYLLKAQVVQDTNRNIAAVQTNLLSRQYHEGETLSYHMKATNKDFFGTRSYEAEASGVVKKDSSGRFLEEHQWTNLIVNTKAIALPPASLNFRQALSLAPDYAMPFPDLSQVHPKLIGPVLDLFNFYVDLQLAVGQQTLSNAGDHVFLKYGKPASWANGPVTIGQDAIDFDITLKAVDQAQQLATVVIRHVPPVKSEITIPAEWMRAPVADTPNNWIQVARNDHYKMLVGITAGICLLLLFLLFRLRNSFKRWIVSVAAILVVSIIVASVVLVPYLQYVGMIGKETFDCEIKVSLINGKIVSVKMDNLVEVLARPCRDAALTKFGKSIRYQIRRQIEIY